MNEVLNMEEGGQNLRRLSADECIYFLSHTNSELRCLALAAIDSDDSVIGVDAYGQIFKQMHEPTLSLGDFNNMIVRSMGALVESSLQDDETRIFTINRIGKLATVLAGHRLDLSMKSSFPTGAILGEHRSSSNPQERIDSFESRLIILTELLNSSPVRWKKLGKFYDNVENQGISHRVAQKHLRNLEFYKIIERRARTNPRGSGRIFEYRFMNNDYYKPSDLISQFLNIVARFAILDEDFLQQGREYAHQVLGQKRNLSSLILRSILFDSHFRNKAKKNPNNTNSEIG